MSSLTLSGVSRTYIVLVLTGLVGSCSGSAAPTTDAAKASGAASDDSAELDSGSRMPATDTMPQLQARPLAVILVAEGDVLDVRSGAGGSYALVAGLQPHTTGLIPTGNAAPSSGERWVQVQLPDAGVGWVNAYFTTEHVGGVAFCDDPRVDGLLGELRAAVQERNGPALAALVSPHHGLVLRRHWWNPEVRYTSGEVASIFTTDARRDWGTADGTGFPIAGSFDDVALPLFDQLYAGKVTRHCNDIESGSGSSAGYRIWPFEYANINYYALYRAAAPGDELNWNTWAVGVEYVDGEPYVAFLVHYQWEI